MTRKDYEAIAAIIRKEHGSCWDGASERIAKGIADHAAQSNSAFDRQRFATACGMTSLD